MKDSKTERETDKFFRKGLENQQDAEVFINHPDKGYAVFNKHTKKFITAWVMTGPQYDESMANDNIRYDKMEKTYLQLSLLEEELKKNGEFLSQDQRKELARSGIRISDHFRWEQKNNFIRVMLKFLRGQITLDEYIDQFYEIDSERQAAQQKLVSDFQTLETFESLFCAI